jgi:hypothetical protein
MIFQSEVLYSLEVIWIDTIMEQNCAYPYQLSWEFCMYFYFAALLQVHHLHAMDVYVFHLLVGRNQPLLKCCVCSQMFCDVEFHEVDIVANIPSQQHYHFHCRNII